jgi:hypothetical protein
MRVGKSGNGAKSIIFGLCSGKGPDCKSAPAGTNVAGVESPSTELAPFGRCPAHGAGAVSISGSLFIKYPYLCLPNTFLMYTRLSARPIILFFSLALICHTLLSQEIPQPVNNTGIYEFLDELASFQIISINSAVKPYSRLFIAQRL